MANYKGNKNRIVRIFNDDLYAMIDLVSEYHNVPVQHVFDVWCEMVMCGEIVKIDSLIKMSEPVDEITE